MNSVDRLYAEEIAGLVIDADGNQSESLPKKPLVLAGSFNPIHRGHKDLLSAAMAMTGDNGYYEISIRNVDKPLLLKTELVKRSEQVLKNGKSLILTSAPRFTEKSSILPGATFVIGFDTCVRLFDETYYPDHAVGSEAAVDNSLDLIEQNGCKFIVAGRINSRGEFQDLSDVSVPQRFRNMFRELTESQFRSDLSSTEMRERF